MSDCDFVVRLTDGLGYDIPNAGEHMRAVWAAQERLRAF